MEAVGHGRYCLDIERFDAPSLMERFVTMVTARDGLQSLFTRRVSEYSRSLDGEFDRLVLAASQQKAVQHSL
jgi:hypothetical protein